MIEDFQLPSRFVLPALAALGFLACTVDGGSSGAGAAGTTSTGGGAGGAGSLGGTPSAAGVAGASGGQLGQAGTVTTGGAGAASAGAGPSGGAGGSAGAVGGSGSGGGAAGGPAGPVGCQGFSGKFCDDFEGQTAGQAPSGDFSVQGKVVVDTGKAFSGTKSIKIEKPTPTGMLRFTEQFPYNDLHGRAMFYVTGIPTDGGPHWDLVVAVSDGGINWEIGGMYGDWLFIIDPPDRGAGAGSFPTDKWFCLQWQYKYAGAGQANTFVAKLDGTSLENGEFTGQDAEGFTWNAGPWDNLSVGFTSYGGNVPVDLWVDDIAFSDAPIACPAAK